jgi:hypothetical protein
LRDPCGRPRPFTRPSGPRPAVFRKVQSSRLTRGAPAAEVSGGGAGGGWTVGRRHPLRIRPRRASP